MPVHNAEIAAMFDEAAELLEIKGDNPFRARAYRQAARIIEGLPKSVAALLKAGEDLTQFPGIGKDLAGKIAAIAKTGKFDLLESLKRELPEELAELATLPGLGPKRVKILYDKLGIRSPGSLRRAIEAGRLCGLRGFGPKIEEKLLAALGKPRGEKRFRLAIAEAEAEALASYLRMGVEGSKVVISGSYRRRRETVGDLDILVTARHGEEAGNKLIHYENVARVIAHGPTRSAVVLRSGLQVDLRAVPEESYGAALMYFTGSKAHNIALRGLANDRGWKLNEYGLFEGEHRIAGATEEEVYAKLGLAFIPPELREDRGEIALAKRNALPKLLTIADIRGDLHVHSNWTDGKAPIPEMAAAAKERGYEYIAITDHSQRVAMARGLNPERLLRQIDEIEKFNGKAAGIKLLKGIEVDILSDGRLDLPDEVLARLDIVVASIHYNFDLPRKEQTERIIKAMDNRHVSIIGHPTGRLIGSREPYDIDLDRIIAAAHERGCQLEINAQPERLDLADGCAHAAKSVGVKLAISTDAHAPAHFGYMRFGVDQARRAWLEAGDVINTRPLRELKKLLKR